MPRPFRMWFYPLPSLIAAVGFIYILFSRPNFSKEIKYAVVLLVIGTVIYMVRAVIRKEWPFDSPEENNSPAPVESDIERA